MAFFPKIKELFYESSLPKKSQFLIEIFEMFKIVECWASFKDFGWLKRRLESQFLKFIKCHTDVNFIETVQVD